MAVSRVKLSSIKQGFPKYRSMLAGNAPLKVFQSTSLPSGWTGGNDLKFINSQFVLGGSNATGGTIATSSDGTSWTNKTQTNGGTTWTNTVAGNSTPVYVMSDASNQSKSGTDLQTWTNRTKGVTGSIQDQIWDSTNSKFIQVGSKSTGSFNTAYSADGVTWTGVAAGTAQLNFLATNAGKTVVGGNTGELYYTTNGGTSWTAGTSNFGSTTIRGVAYGNGVWVIVGDSGTLASSTDGITYTLRTSSFSTSNIEAVTWSNGTFMAVSSSTNKIATSTDGTTWTQMSMYRQPFVTGDSFYNVTANTTGTFVLYCSGATSNFTAWITL